MQLTAGCMRHCTPVKEHAQKHPDHTYTCCQTAYAAVMSCIKTLRLRTTRGITWRACRYSIDSCSMPVHLKCCTSITYLHYIEQPSLATPIQASASHTPHHTLQTYNAVLHGPCMEPR
jgi:hypothetical protein